MRPLAASLIFCFDKASPGDLGKSPHGPAGWPRMIV